MLYEILSLVLTTVAWLLGSALLLRAYFCYLRTTPYHPLVQMVMLLTQPLVAPWKKLMPRWVGIDWPSLLSAWLLALFMWGFLFFLRIGMMETMAMSMPLLVQASLSVLEWALYLVLWITIADVLMSWLAPTSSHRVLLTELTRPLLTPLRRMLPRSQLFDFSPLVLLLLVQIGFIVLRNLRS